MSIPRVTKITSSCTKSFEGAIQVGISRANETLENVKGAWIQEQKVVVEKGKITEYRVNMKVTLKSFKLHPEINNYGFYVQRGGELGNLTDAEEGFVPGHNTTVEPQSYSWTDKSPARYYRLRQVDMDGIWHLSEILVNPQTDIESATADPVAFALDQNYPNPFNPSTTIRYELPRRSYVTLAIFSTLGQQVAELVNGEVEAGYHSVQFDGSNLASGMYIYRLQTGDFTQTRIFCLIR